MSIYIHYKLTDFLCYSTVLYITVLFTPVLISYDITDTKTLLKKGLFVEKPTRVVRQDNASNIPCCSFQGSNSILMILPNKEKNKMFLLCISPCALHNWDTNDATRARPKTERNKGRVASFSTKTAKLHSQ